NKIYLDVKRKIGNLSQKEIFLIGVSLYWGEGSKEKEGRRGNGLEFTNSDYKMVYFYIKWLVEVLKVDRDRVRFGIYIHQNKKSEIASVIKFWSNITGFPKEKFDYVYYKKNAISTNRKNIKDNYFGSLKIKVTSSSNLYKMVAGSIEAIYENCRIV